MADSGIVAETEAVEAIGIAAGRIRRFAEAIQQGHSFGIEPGVHDEPWTLGFQRVAVDIYSQTLPWPYLTRLAEAFEDCANLMVTASAPSSIARDWSRMQQYLRSASKAIVEAAPGVIESDDLPSAQDIAPTTPPVMPFSQLARLMSVEGVASLAAIGSVELACDQHDDCPITEQEKEWLSRLRDGDRVLDIAVDHGYSERNLYRALSDLWKRLDVDNRREAIGLAMKQDWIS